jgi:hypothetical protein
MRCKCGEHLRDDDSEWTLTVFRFGEFDVDEESADLLSRSTDIWRCRNCDRLWAFWQRGSGVVPVEYVNPLKTPVATSVEGTTEESGAS